MPSPYDNAVAGYQQEIVMSFAKSRTAGSVVSSKVIVLGVIATFGLWGQLGVSSAAQAAPWLLYVDEGSPSVCDVVNAANIELVVLSDTGQLAGITGTDVIFLDTFVDGDGLVWFLDDPAGTIEFVEDGDGFRTLWWLTSQGDVVNVNEFTGEPGSTGLFPEEFFDVPCEACPQWDVPEECVDEDDDGVADALDLCPDTLFDEVADGVGCSCGQLDSDLDGVDDCIDLCPETPLSFLAEADGCACEELDDDLDGIDSCFDLCPNTPPLELADANGCSCGQLDNDLDGVDDCDDLCFGTALGASVDFDGCEVILVLPGGGGTTVNFCGSTSTVALVVMVFGLVGFRQSLRNRIV